MNDKDGSSCRQCQRGRTTSRPQRQRGLALDWDVALGKDDGGVDEEQDADVEENGALGFVIAFGVAACEGASDLQDVHGQSYDAMPRYGPCRPPRPAGSAWIAAGFASVVSGTAVARVFQLEHRGYPVMK